MLPKDEAPPSFMVAGAPTGHGYLSADASARTTPLPPKTLSPGHFFSGHLKEYKKSAGEVSHGGKNDVGAACSAYLLSALDTLTARKPARSPLSPASFPPLPKKCPGESPKDDPQSPL